MWIRVFMLILALALVPVLVVAPPAGSAATSLRPQLRLVDSAPLTLTGLHFRSREFVRVTVTDGRRTLVRQARASTTGAFTVAFAGVRYDPCGTPPEITARGMRSGRVTGIGPVRDCAMP